MKKPFLLMILDGFGNNKDKKGNAIAAASTPNLDRLCQRGPVTQLSASGLDVGLPQGQMGNSEVGHTNIGAGRIVYQELTRITKAIDEGDFFQNAALCAAVQNCKKNGTALHLMGLLSDGGVHSHIQHLMGLLRLAQQEGLQKVYVHCFMDGRDVSPTSGKGYIEQLEQFMRQLGVGVIATVSGRYYAMDRDNRWDRVEKAYLAIAEGRGPKAENAAAMVEASYQEGITDEFIIPTVINPAGSVSPKDSVVFFNFRPDRARELTRAFVDEDFTGFVRSRGFFPLTYVCMTQYDAAMPNVQVAFTPQKLENTLGQYLSEKGLRQLRIAETEKYAHVTFFFNGGVETVYPGEDRALIPSPKVATYDLQPQMSAPEVTEELLRRLDTGEYDVIILNYANCDMVGHTGVFPAAVKAVETVDSCVGRVVDKVLAMGGCALITADHGNADRMLEEDGTPFTAHTTNPVPLIGVGLPEGAALADGGRLADLAPTLLAMMGLPQPQEMEGHSLLMLPKKQAEKV